MGATEKMMNHFSSSNVIQKSMANATDSTRSKIAAFLRFWEAGMELARTISPSTSNLDVRRLLCHKIRELNAMLISRFSQRAGLDSEL